MVKPGEGGEILVGQEDYIKDVINRYGSEVKEKLIPVPKEIEKDGEDEELDMEMVRRAQTLSGELLWATRTRPDISYGVNRISQLIARQARRAYDMGIYLLGFLKKTVDWKLEFGAAAEGHGENGEYVYERGMNTVEVYADAGFGPDGGRSQRGVIVCYSGCPIHWTSTRQPFVARSTAEAVVGSHGGGAARGSLGGDHRRPGRQEGGIGVGQGIDVEGRDQLRSLKLVMMQDNAAAVTLLQGPGGSWRTRPLKIRPRRPGRDLRMASGRCSTCRARRCWRASAPRPWEALA